MTEKMKADDCRGRRTRIETTFSNFICRGVERIDGRLYGQVFIIITEVRWQMGSYMGRNWLVWEAME